MNIIFRSGWEYKFMRYLDSKDNVLEWASEEIKIPYISPVDGKVHRYHVDFYVKIDNGRSVDKYLVEIKPYSEKFPPQRKRKTRLLEEAQRTYAVNQAKWKAAEAFCEKHGLQFKVFTEVELFGKKPKKRG